MAGFLGLGKSTKPVPEGHIRVTVTHRNSRGTWTEQIDCIPGQHTLDDAIDPLHRPLHLRPDWRDWTFCDEGHQWSDKITTELTQITLLDIDVPT